MKNKNRTVVASEARQSTPRRGDAPAFVKLCSRLRLVDCRASLATTIRFLFLFSLFATQLNAESPSKLAPMIPLLEAKLIEAQTIFNVPGIAIAIVESDKIIYAKGFGERAVGLKEPITTETVFQLGSVSKGFTATLIAKLMGDGKLDWNKTVKSYVPNFQLANETLTEKLTLKDVLSQRSGIPSYACDDWIQKGKYYTEAFPHLKEVEPIAPIGQKFCYQNVLYCITDQVLQKTTNESWHDSLQKNLLKPAGIMKASTSLQAIEQEQNTAKPHVTGRAGAFELPWSQFGYLVPCAGGINMNINELARYLMLHINQGTIDGKTVISAALMKEIHSPQVSTVGRETSGYKVYYYPKERVKHTSYGMGFRMCDWGGHQVVGHGGYVRGQLSSVTFLPGQKVGLAVLTNAASVVPSIIRAHFIDMSLNLPPIDWLERAKLKKIKDDAKDMKRKVKPVKTKKQKIAKTI